VDDTTPKCLRCSHPIRDGEIVIFQQGDWVHLRCWQIVASAEHLRVSRQLTERSREKLKQSRERVERIWEALSARRGIVCAVCHFPVSVPDLVFTSDGGLAHRVCVPSPPPEEPAEPDARPGRLDAGHDSGQDGPC